MPSARILPPALAALGVLLPSVAHAQDRVVFSAGTSISLSFGQKVSFGLGLDLRVTGLVSGALDPCLNRYRDPHVGLGPFLQATWLNFSAFRFAAGVHGGREFVPEIYGLDAELGWTYRTRYNEAESGQHGIHVGALNTFSSVFVDAPVRVAIPLSTGPFIPEGSIGIGFHYFPPFGAPASGCTVGRPLRVGDAVVLPPALVVGPGACHSARIDRETREALAGAWLADAQTECASIPAFLALARDLEAVGAPAFLIAQALAAAGDEARHTALCSELASSFAGWRITPAEVAPPTPRDADRRSALLRLALESWHDGCLGEGAAAVRAKRALAGTAGSAAAKALAVIARDEARHAELGWRVLAYCLAEGGRNVRDALAGAILAPERSPPEVEMEREVDRTATRSHGRLGRAEAEAAWSEAWTAARRTGEQLLAAT